MGHYGNEGVHLMVHLAGFFRQASTRETTVAILTRLVREAAGISVVTVCENIRC